VRSVPYRPEIDGLRAVAVLGVLAYHAAGIVPGGFAGVDVFFVISGYVITSVIAAELRRGDFTIARFYERRIRRIAPALLATILATTIGAAIFLLPADLISFGKSAVAATLMVSNIGFWLKAGYFDAAMQSKPLLHTWSLGIEEQFYLFYPLLLAWLWRRRRTAVAPVLAGLFVVSLAAGVVATDALPSAAFYLAPFRLWELLLGGLIALRPVRRLEGAGAAAVGALMIAAAFTFYGGATAFPGAAALLPTLGAALVINGTSKGGLVARVLSAPPLTFVGKISYSLYLVHWPLIVFIEYRQGAELGPWQAAGVAALSILLAALSWRFVEQPFRRPEKFGSRRALYSAGAAGAAICCLAGGVLVVTHGLPSRLPEPVLAAYSAHGDRWNEERCFIDTDGSGGPTPAEIRAGKICAFGPADRTTADFLIWGDSHAHAIAPGILAAAKRFGARGYFVGAGSCPPLRDFDTVGVRPSTERRCAETNAAVLDFLRTHKVGAVFMVARWTKYAQGNEYGREGMMFDPAKVPGAVPGEDAKLAAAMDETLSQIVAGGEKPVVVMAVPEPGYDVPYSVAKALLQRTPPDAIAPTLEAVAARQARARDILTEETEKDGGLFVDPTAALCGPVVCPVEQDGQLLYSDADHITIGAALAISYIFDDAFRQIMKSSR